MKNFFNFWQKDIINKLIVILSSGLTVGLIGFIILIFFMPAGKSFTGAIGEYLPTATLEPRMIMTRSAAQAQTESAVATASVPSTITTMPFTPFKASQTPNQAPAGQLQATIVPSTPTQVLPTATPQAPIQTPTPILPTPTPTRAPLKPTSTPSLQIPGTPVSLACIPANPPQTGKVLSVLDGNTIKVLINGFAYNVRYIGIQSPANKNYATLASVTNGTLVFAKNVTLISDVLDKDERGFLLRYVKVGEMVPSLELLKQGLASALDTPPNSACAQAFKSVEQSAQSAGIGLWAPAPTPALSIRQNDINPCLSKKLLSVQALMIFHLGQPFLGK